MTLRTALLSLLLLTFGAAAQEPTYQRLLIPIYTPLPASGAFGTRWAVESWVIHGGTGEAHVVPRPTCFAILCTLGATLEPNRPPQPVDALPLDAQALLFHVDSEHAGVVHMQTRIRDLTHQERSAGTEIPAIPETGMYGTRFQLQNVPVAEGFRATLRVYALPEIPNPDVEIRYYRMPKAGLEYSIVPVLLRTDHVRLRTYGPVGEFQLQPSVAMIGNLQALPEIASEAALWIDIVPLTPGLRAWAFVSVTNDETQEVTLITP